MSAKASATITVLAGVNGAGKSSVGGARLRASGGVYYNPDEAAKLILKQRPDLSSSEANSHAWYQGKRLLERAIAERLDFTFETTLGGSTIASLLEQALDEDIGVRIWYVGLESAELHIARVQARVARGGHSIPAAKIRERYITSRTNLIRLLPRVQLLKVYDNTTDGDPAQGELPRPKLLLHVERARVVHLNNKDMPNWAKPIAAAAARRPVG